MPATPPSEPTEPTKSTVSSESTVSSTEGGGVLVGVRERVGLLIGAAGAGLEDGPRQAAELGVLGARLRVLAAQVAVVEAELAVVAVEVEAREGLLEGCSGSWWVGFHGGLTEGESRRLMRGARALGRLPVLGEALAAGTISLGTFNALATVATTENEAALLASTGSCTARQVENLVATMRKLTKDEAGDADEPPESSIRVARRGDGRWSARIDASADEGALIEKALRSVLKGLDEPGSPDGLVEDPATVADSEMLPGSARVQDNRFDALLELCRRMIADAGAGRGPTGARYQMIVHTNLDGLAGAFGADVTDAQAWIEGHGSMDPKRLCEMIGESSLRFLLFSGIDPVAMSKQMRFVDARQLRALYARDLGCQWPGCGKRHDLHAHHLLGWAFGGPTVLENLVLICGKHHRRIHRNGWDLRRDVKTGGVVLIHPNGRRFDPGLVGQSDYPWLRLVDDPDPPGDQGAPPGRRNIGSGEPATRRNRCHVIQNWFEATYGVGVSPHAA